MKYIVGCLEGIEDVCKEEIVEELKVNPKQVIPGRIQFDSKEIKELRSIHTIYELISYFKFKSLSDILGEIKRINFSFIKKDFVVRCNKENNDLKSMEIERKVGEVLFEEGYKVNLKSKLVIYIDIIGDACFVGKLVEKNLNKRKYRLRRHNQGIDACLAYALVKLIKSKSIYDPFCKDGVILIEAGLSGITELYGMDNPNNLRIANINSKLAKIKIKFLKPERIETVTSNVIGLSSNKVEKLFESAKKVVAITQDMGLLEGIANKKRYKLVKKRRIGSGKSGEIAVFRA